MIMKPLEVHWLRRLRANLTFSASGKVLEIGIGTGANLPYYDPAKVTSLTGLDVKLPKEIQGKNAEEITLVEGNAEILPFGSGSFDTVVATLVFCSVGDSVACLSEVKRVLKDGGRYLFIEHILPEKHSAAKWFRRISPLWTKMACGCNIDRRTDLIIQSNGFSKVTLKKQTKGIFCYGVAEK